MNYRFLIHNGETLTIAQWAKKLGINRDSFVSRLRRGWSMDDIANTPIRHKDIFDATLTNERIDNGVESWQELMFVRGYFRKKNKIKVYKQLNTWYKEFRAQDMRAA